MGGYDETQGLCELYEYHDTSEIFLWVDFEQIIL